MVIRLVRGHGETTPVEGPADQDPNWQQMDLLAAVCHSGSASSGHWQAFCRLQGVWWNVDPGQSTIVQRNPFQCQHQLKIMLLLLKE